MILFENLGVVYQGLEKDPKTQLIADLGNYQQIFQTLNVRIQRRIDQKAN